MFRTKVSLPCVRANKPISNESAKVDLLLRVVWKLALCAGDLLSMLGRCMIGSTVNLT